MFTGTKCLQGQSVYEDIVYRNKFFARTKCLQEQSVYKNKLFTRTNCLQEQTLLKQTVYEINCLGEQTLYDHKLNKKKILTGTKSSQEQTVYKNKRFYMRTHCLLDQTVDEKNCLQEQSLYKDKLFTGTNYLPHRLLTRRTFYRNKLFMSDQLFFNEKLFTTANNLQELMDRQLFSISFYFS